MGGLDEQRLGDAATALSETAPHPMENVLLEFVSLPFKLSKRLPDRGCYFPQFYLNPLSSQALLPPASQRALNFPGLPPT